MSRIGSKLLPFVRQRRLLLRDTALSYGSNVLSGAAQLATFAVLARTMPKTDVALVVLSTAISGTLATASEFGAGPLLATQYQTLPDSDGRLWAALVRWVVRLVAAVTVIGLAVAGATSVVLALTGARTAVVAVVGLGLATGSFSFLIGYIQTFLVARKRFVVGAGLTVLPALLRLAGTTFLALTAHPGAEAVVLIYFASTLATTAIFIWTLPRPIVPQHQGAAVASEARRLASSVMRWVIVSRAASVLTGRLDVFLLSALGTASAVAVYAAGYQLATPFVMLGNALGQVALPYLGVQDEANAGHLARRWLTWAPVLGIAAILASAAGFVALPIIFGESYVATRGVFVILVFAFAAQAWMQPLVSSLYALSRPRSVAAVALFYMLCAVPLEVLLIAWRGSVGAAAGILLASALTDIYCLRLVRRQRPQSGGR